MNRRNFLTLGAAAASALNAQISARIEGGPARGLRFIDRKRGLHPFRADAAAKRPNIFVLTVDMISADHYLASRPAQREMDLPTLRSLASDSVVFTNAFCTSPLCAPARAATATGRYTYITANGERAHDGHETILRPSDAIYPEYLKATGYRTKHCGKGHLGVQKFFDAFDENAEAWDRWDPPVRTDEGYLSYLRRLGVKPQRYRKELRGLQQDRKTPANSFGGWIEQTGGKDFPLEAQYSYYLARLATEKLDSALEGGGAPVYLQLDLFDPHQPFSIPAGFEAREREMRRAFGALPESYQTAVRRDFRPAPGEPKIYDQYRRYWGLYNPETVRDYRVANALQVEVIDRALGVFVGALKQRGIYDDSVIIFMADHGEMNGRQALVDKGVYMHPEVFRIPMMVKMPRGAGAKPHTVDAPVSQLDIAPTVLGIAGIEPEARMDGLSLAGHLERTAAPADRALFFECGWHVSANFACGTQRWERGGGHFLYGYNVASPFDELYDMTAADPVNLAETPDRARTRREMIARLGAILQEDPRWLGFWSSYRLDKYFDLPRTEGDMQMRQR